MKIKCMCGNIVVEGELINTQERRNKFDISYKPKGTIIKNNSNNPKDWQGICSACQKRRC